VVSGGQGQTDEAGRGSGGDAGRDKPSPYYTFRRLV